MINGNLTYVITVYYTTFLLFAGLLTSTMMVNASSDSASANNSTKNSTSTITVTVGPTKVTGGVVPIGNNTNGTFSISIAPSNVTQPK